MSQGYLLIGQSESSVLRYVYDRDALRIFHTFQRLQHHGRGQYHIATLRLPDNLYRGLSSQPLAR